MGQVVDAVEAVNIQNDESDTEINVVALVHEDQSEEYIQNDRPLELEETRKIPDIHALDAKDQIDLLGLTGFCMDHFDHQFGESAISISQDDFEDAKNIYHISPYDPLSLRFALSKDQVPSTRSVMIEDLYNIFYGNETDSDIDAISKTALVKLYIGPGIIQIDNSSKERRALKTEKAKASALNAQMKIRERIITLSEELGYGCLAMFGSDVPNKELLIINKIDEH